MSTYTDTVPLALSTSRTAREAWFFAACALLLLFSLTVASALGAVALPLETTGRLLVKGILQLPIEEGERAQAAIVYLIRFPRVLAAALVGACLALSGVMLQGLFRNPHLMRLLVGPDHRVLLPVAAFAGATFLVWCDLLARTVVPTEELRLGVITAFIGAPIFLSLLWRQEQRQRGLS
jgi:iron complex transport system permease protein